jgi:DNA-binding MarR family transcriptional regulator
MPRPVTPDKLDPVIHERVRLTIVSVLAMVHETTFGELKTTLNVTDGNLSAHSRVLELAGYIEVRKFFRGRRPVTMMRLSAKGRQTFRRYLEVLRRIVEQGRAAAKGN